MIDAIVVEERDRSALMRSGITGGITAGLVLAAAEILASAALGRPPSSPFRFVSALLLGPDVFAPGYSPVILLAVGAAVHLTLSIVFGTLFFWLLACTFQLSARTGLLLVYGALYGVLLWEINFLALVPAFFPHVAERVGPASQIANGIIGYALFYGLVLGEYQARARVGVRARWAR